MRILAVAGLLDGRMMVAAIGSMFAVTNLAMSVASRWAHLGMGMVRATAHRCMDEHRESRNK
jgi:hypothetical protein